MRTYEATLTTVDGIETTKTYKTEKGLAKFVENHTGLQLVDGKSHYVADDGVAVVDVSWIDDEPIAPAEELPQGEIDQIAEPRTVKAKCLECGHGWELNPEEQKCENVLCPECGAWCLVRLHPDKERYYRGLGTTVSGNSTLDIGDEVAGMLRGISVYEAYKVAGEELAKLVGELGVGVLGKGMAKDLKSEPNTPEVYEQWLEARYYKRNDGMRRMNTGNVLRNALKRAAELRAIAEIDNK